MWSQGEGPNGPAPGSGPGKEEGGGNGGSGAAGMGSGEDNMAVVPTGVGRVGGLICWESKCGVRSVRGGLELRGVVARGEVRGG